MLFLKNKNNNKIDTIKIKEKDRMTEYNRDRIIKNTTKKEIWSFRPKKIEKQAWRINYMTENIEDKVLMIIHTKEMMIGNKEKTNLMKETLKLLKRI